MPVTVIATPGAANANSYATVAEATEYFGLRIPLTPPWDPTDDVAGRALITATRVLDTLAVARKRLVRPDTSRRTNGEFYYMVGRKWMGLPTTTIQVLAWPRIGMKDRNGNDIPSNVIPKELKEATAELAGQLEQGDRTLDNAVLTQGIRSVSASGVSVNFKDDIDQYVISDMTMNLMPPWWFDDETIEMVTRPEFRMI